MALTMSHEAPTGDDYPAAYCRVVHVNHDVDRGIVTFNVAVYRDEAARRDGRRWAELREYAVSREDHDAFFAPDVLTGKGASPVSQAYRWLRAHHPDYGKAADA